MTTAVTGTELPADANAPVARRDPAPRPATLLRALRALTRSRIGMVGLVLVLFWVVVALLAPLLAPYDPYALHTAYSNHPPTREFLLGTDFYGRDVLSRIIMGS